MNSISTINVRVLSGFFKVKMHMDLCYQLQSDSHSERIRFSSFWKTHYVRDSRRLVRMAPSGEWKSRERGVVRTGQGLVHGQLREVRRDGHERRANRSVYETVCVLLQGQSRRYPRSFREDE